MNRLISPTADSKRASIALQVSESRCNSSRVSGTGSLPDRFDTLIERVAAVISSTGLSAFRLSTYPPSAETASTPGMAHRRPPEKARRTVRLPSSGAAAHKTSDSDPEEKG